VHTTFTIVDVNHFPVLDKVASMTIKEDQRFKYQIKAKDPDRNDVLKFTCESNLFACSSSGLIDVVPRQKDVGAHMFMVKVTDGQLEDREYLNITVEDINDPPYVVPPKNQTADNRRGYLFVFEQGGSDYADGYDSYYNNTNTFSDDSPLFDVNPRNGTISFQPTAAQIGTYIIHITVTDKFGLTYTTVMNLTIVVKNTLPVVDIVQVSKRAPVPGVPFTLTAKATDQDGDNLTYAWFGGSDGKTPLGTGKNLTQKVGKAGKYTYTVKVSDGIGVTAKNYTVAVRAEGNNFIPGFGAGGLVSVIIVAALVLAARYRGRSRKV
jgi:hypothetical protein